MAKEVSSDKSSLNAAERPMKRPRLDSKRDDGLTVDKVDTEDLELKSDTEEETENNVEETSKPSDLYLDTVCNQNFSLPVVVSL